MSVDFTITDFITMMHNVEPIKDSIMNIYKFTTPFIFVNTTWKLLQCSYNEDGKPCYVNNMQENLSVSFSDINYRCFTLKQYFMDLINPIISQYESFYTHFDISFEEQLEEDFDEEEKGLYYENNKERTSISIAKRLLMVFTTTVNVDEGAMIEFQNMIDEFCYGPYGLYCRIPYNKKKYMNFLIKVAAFNYHLSQSDIGDDDLIETEGVVCLRSVFDDSTGFVSSSKCEDMRLKYIRYFVESMGGGEYVFVDLSVVANYYQLYNYLSKILK